MYNVAPNMSSIPMLWTVLLRSKNVSTAVSLVARNSVKLKRKQQKCTEVTKERVEPVTKRPNILSIANQSCHGSYETKCLLPVILLYSLASKRESLVNGLD